MVLRCAIYKQMLLLYRMIPIQVDFIPPPPPLRPPSPPPLSVWINEIYSIKRKRVQSNLFFNPIDCPKLCSHSHASCGLKTSLVLFFS